MSELHVVLGSGPLGRSVVNELVKRGKAVKVVNRSGQMKDAPQGVIVAPGNVYDAANVRALAQGAAVVYQCAQPEYHEWPEKFPPLIRAVLEGLSGSGARLVVGENLYLYGEVNGPLHEGLPYAAQTRKGKARAQAAEAVLAAHRAGKVRAAIGRGSDFFGPYVLDSLFGERAFYPALAGKAAQMAGSLDAPHTATYVEDFGRPGAGDSGRARRGAGAGLARAERSAAPHPARIRDDGVRGDRPAPEDGRPGAAHDDDRRPVYPRRARDGGDDVRVREAVCGGQPQVRKGIWRDGHADPRGDQKDGGVVSGQPGDHEPAPCCPAGGKKAGLSRVRVIFGSAWRSDFPAPRQRMKPRLLGGSPQPVLHLCDTGRSEVALDISNVSRYYGQ